MSKPIVNIVFFVSVLILLLCNACHVEKRMAYKYVDNAQEITVLLLEPDVFLLSDLKKSTQTDNLGNEETNIFLNDIDVAWASQLFSETLLKELAAYKLKVLTASQLDTFFTIPTNAHMFNIAQVEIEEFFSPFKDTFEKSPFDTVVYVQNFLLNALNFNTWVEYSKLNSDEKNQVLFSNFYISDEVNGRFFINRTTKEVLYSYTMSEIDTNAVEALIKYAAVTNARYMFNYLLNKHIKASSNNKVATAKFYFYDKAKNKILLLDKFQEFKLIE